MSRNNLEVHYLLIKENKWWQVTREITGENEKTKRRKKALS